MVSATRVAKQVRSAFEPARRELSSRQSQIESRIRSQIGSQQEAVARQQQALQSQQAVRSIGLQERQRFSQQLSQQSSSLQERLRGVLQEVGTVFAGARERLSEAQSRAIETVTARASRIEQAFGEQAIAQAEEAAGQSLSGQERRRILDQISERFRVEEQLAEFFPPERDTRIPTTQLERELGLSLPRDLRGLRGISESELRELQSIPRQELRDIRDFPSQTFLPPVAGTTQAGIAAAGTFREDIQRIINLPLATIPEQRIQQPFVTAGTILEPPPPIPTSFLPTTAELEARQSLPLDVRGAPTIRLPSGEIVEIQPPVVPTVPGAEIIIPEFVISPVTISKTVETVFLEPARIIPEVLGTQVSRALGSLGLSEEFITTPRITVPQRRTLTAQELGLIEPTPFVPIITPSVVTLPGEQIPPPTVIPALQPFPTIGGQVTTIPTAIGGGITTLGGLAATAGLFVLPVVGTTLAASEVVLGLEDITAPLTETVSPGQKPDNVSEADWEIYLQDVDKFNLSVEKANTSTRLRGAFRVTVGTGVIGLKLFSKAQRGKLIQDLQKQEPSVQVVKGDTRQGQRFVQQLFDERNPGRFKLTKEQLSSYNAYIVRFPDGTRWRFLETGKVRTITPGQPALFGKRELFGWRVGSTGKIEGNVFAYSLELGNPQSTTKIITDILATTRSARGLRRGAENLGIVQPRTSIGRVTEQIEFTGGRRVNTLISVSKSGSEVKLVGVQGGVTRDQALKFIQEKGAFSQQERLFFPFDALSKEGKLVGSAKNLDLIILKPTGFKKGNFIFDIKSRNIPSGRVLEVGGAKLVLKPGVIRTDIKSGRLGFGKFTPAQEKVVDKFIKGETLTSSESQLISGFLDKLNKIKKGFGSIKKKDAGKVTEISSQEGTTQISATRDFQKTVGNLVSPGQVPATGTVTQAAIIGEAAVRAPSGVLAAIAGAPLALAPSVPEVTPTPRALEISAQPLEVTPTPVTEIKLTSQETELVSLRSEQVLKQISQQRQVTLAQQGFAQPQAQRFTQRQIQNLLTGQLIAQKQRQQLRTQQLLQQQQRPGARQLRQPISPRAPLIPPIPLPTGAQAKVVLQALRKLKGQGVDVIVSRGKKKTTIAKNVPRFKGLRKGLDDLSETFRSTLELKATGKKPKGKDIAEFEIPVREFRPSRKDPLKIVERKEFRLDTSLEKRVLQAERRRKGGFKGRKKKKLL